MKIKEIFSKFAASTKRDFSMRIYSLIIAILAWIAISISVFPTTTINLRDIEVNVDIAGTSAERNNLSVISIDDQNVSASVTGSRSAIGGLSSTDFIAKAEIEDVTAAGEYELLLTLECKKPNVDFQYTINPEKVKVSFDRIVSKNFELTADVPNIKAEDGYLKGKAEVAVASITISGPEEKVNYITSCAIQNLSEMTLTDSIELTSDNNLLLYHNNTVISSDELTFSRSAFTINVPVTMRKTLPLKVNFVNVPDGFPIEELKYTQSVSEIEIAAPSEKIESLGELYLGTIDLRKVVPGYSVTLPIEFSEEMECENLSEVSEVTLDFPLEEFETRVITISRNDISVINGPSDYDITPVTTGWDVTFIGEENALSELTVQDIVVQLDLTSVSSSITGNDYFRAPITISVPDKEMVWAVGSQSVAFQAKEK